MSLAKCLTSIENANLNKLKKREYISGEIHIRVGPSGRWGVK